MQKLSASTPVLDVPEHINGDHGKCGWFVIATQQGGISFPNAFISSKFDKWVSGECSEDIQKLIA